MGVSAKQVQQMQLTCDGCGVTYPTLAAPVARLREIAERDGWKHRAVRYSKSNWCKQVDVCPTCRQDDARVLAVVSGAMVELEGQRGS